MPLIQLDQCPACEGRALEPYLTCNDYLVSQQSFPIVQCSTCGLRFTNPRPDNDSLGTYYKSDAYISHNDTGKGVVATAYRLVRSYTLRQKVDQISRLNGGRGSIFDVGCGTGTFLEACQKKAWRIGGMEPDPDARQVATARLQTTLLKNLNEVPATAQFDVVTMWHVLEHVPDLHATLGRLHQLLRPGGTLLIAVPNSQSWDAGQYGPQWAAYDVPRHLYHFTPQSLKQLVEPVGFREVEQKPMLFDAFYIAMLSTQHRDGKINYVESLQKGLQSNLNAARTGQYSSITYVFKRP